MRKLTDLCSTLSVTVNLNTKQNYRSTLITLVTCFAMLYLDRFSDWDRATVLTTPAYSTPVYPTGCACYDCRSVLAGWAREWWPASHYTDARLPRSTAWINTTSRLRSWAVDDLAVRCASQLVRRWTRLSARSAHIVHCRLPEVIRSAVHQTSSVEKESIWQIQPAIARRQACHDVNVFMNNMYVGLYTCDRKTMKLLKVCAEKLEN